MTKKYIVVDYRGGKSEDPGLAAESTGLDSALQAFEKLKNKNKTKSVVLFDTQTAIVEKIAILGEPIYLAKAIKFARTFVPNTSILQQVGNQALKSAASAIIQDIGKAIAEGPVPGFGGAVMGHFIAPYYAAKDDLVAVAKSATGMYGGLSGAIIGFVVGGPVGAFVGGVAGGVGMGGVGALVKAVIDHPKCNYCNGTGLVDYYEVCDTCEGYGYMK